MKTTVQQSILHICSHCGDICNDNAIYDGNVFFCCEGCKTVYKLLQNNNLCGYYAVDGSEIHSLKKLSTKSISRFAYLDDSSIAESILAFKNDKKAQLVLQLPSVHCTSCVWLLEKLPHLHPGILRSELQLSGKQISILFNPEQVTVREIVELLTLLGYEPDISLAAMHKQTKDTSNRSMYIRLAIAGFAFGNTMMVSLPGYFDEGIGDLQSTFTIMFAALNILFSLPVILYSSQPFFKNAWSGFRNSTMNVDIPISMGILAIYSRSIYEIFMGIGPGFMDSFSGLVFFLLIGRVFQKKSFDALEFDRDFNSYVPLQCTKIEHDTEKSIAASSIIPGDILLVRNQEIIPSDAILLSANGHIDYSFITGESTPVEILKDTLIYAGARVLGPSILIEIKKEISRSGLLRMWNNTLFRKPVSSTLLTVSTLFGTYFTFGTIVLAIIAGLFYLPHYSMALSVFSAVLIIACPCALTLAVPFTLGNIMRISAKYGLYFKNTDTVLELASVDTIVFDKTGTLTSSLEGTVEYIGEDFSETQLRLIISGCLSSTHPKSRILASWLCMNNNIQSLKGLHCDSFQEFTGKGWIAAAGKYTIRLGNYEFVSHRKEHKDQIWVSVNAKLLGYFIIKEGPRHGILSMIDSLTKALHVDVFLISGDSNRNAGYYTSAFKGEHSLLFHQSPEDKARFILSKQNHNHAKVAMIGDGINDSGALMQSNIGIAVAEHISAFHPGCDAIMSANSLSYLDAFIQFTRKGITIIKAAFWISVIYNIIGLTLAVMGILTPVYTAILMPISSLTVIGFTLGMSSFAGRKIALKENQ